VLAFGCYTYCVVFAVSCLWPYAHFRGFNHSSDERGFSLSGLWIDRWSPHERLVDVQQLILRRKPTLVVFSGYLSEGLDDYAHRAVTASLENGGIRILSQIPIASQQIDQLGLESFPGGVFTLQPPSGPAIEVGVMALKPSMSQEIFERNRITARRLSSLMRNSSAPRLVAAEFATTPFSSFVSVYSEQAKLRSLMFGQGLLKTFNLESPLALSNDSNVFVSRDLEPVVFERIILPGRARSVLYFEVRVSPLLHAGIKSSVVDARIWKGLL
jgi:hypothetical protein